MKKGKLYLIPSPLGEEGLAGIPEHTLSVLHALKHLVAERAKTTRRLLKSSGFSGSLQEVRIEELNKRTEDQDIRLLLEPARQGQDMGMISEAGCPGVADPGARLVEAAHREGIRVVPLVGPSSILLALMGSGLSGQQFCFHGYLSPKRPQLGKDLKRLEQLARRFKQTQIFMETPYRNMAVLEEAIKNLSPSTRFAVAADLTLPTEYVHTQTIAEWKKKDLPELHKRPAIFLIG
jgi:16S rRNA (cytidine1402-2'-O)-methyltransferase